MYLCSIWLKQACGKHFSASTKGCNNALPIVQRLSWEVFTKFFGHNLLTSSPSILHITWVWPKIRYDIRPNLTYDKLFHADNRVIHGMPLLPTHADKGSDWRQEISIPIWWQSLQLHCSLHALYGKILAQSYNLVYLSSQALLQYSIVFSSCWWVVMLIGRGFEVQKCTSDRGCHDCEAFWYGDVTDFGNKSWFNGLFFPLGNLFKGLFIGFWPWTFNMMGTATQRPANLCPEKNGMYKFVRLCSGLVWIWSNLCLTLNATCVVSPCAEICLIHFHSAKKAPLHAGSLECTSRNFYICGEYLPFQHNMKEHSSLLSESKAVQLSEAAVFATLPCLGLHVCNCKPVICSLVAPACNRHCQDKYLLK